MWIGDCCPGIPAPLITPFLASLPIISRAGVRIEGVFALSSFFSFRLLSTVLVASAASVSIHPAVADESGPPVSDNARLKTTVVTATRTAVTVDDSVSTVKVLDRQDIEHSQASSVEELLQGFAGLHFTNNGGRGKATSLFLRGTNSDHVVVLIDGVKVGSATLGSVPFQDLPVEQIDRIEIVRGARSSLYGSEAIGGVIQIFTRKGQGESRGFATATAGSQDTFEGALGMSGGDQLFYSASASGTHTTGFDSCKAEANGSGGCWNDEPDKDGYESFSGNLRLGYDFGNGSEVSVLAMETNSKNDFDGGSQNSSETTQRVLGLSADAVLSDAYVLKLQAGRSRDKSDNFLDEEFVTHFDTTRDSVSLQNDIALLDNVLVTFGGDYLRDEVDSSSDYDEKERENLGGFLQSQWQLGAADIEVSGRYDDNEAFGNHSTFGLGLGFDLADNVRLVASHGTAFKAPTFNQLYFPFFGSPELNPEESRTTEVGIRAHTNQQRWALTLFKTVVDDLIVYDSNIFAANNLDKSEIKGLEVELSNRFSEQWQADVNVTFMDPENISDNANSGKVLPRRPQRSARLDLNYANNGWRLGSTLNMVGTRYEDAANNRKLSAYRTVDLRVERELSPEWRVQAKLVNVTDTDYEKAAFYNQQERSVFFTVRYQAL